MKEKKVSYKSNGKLIHYQIFFHILFFLHAIEYVTIMIRNIIDQENIFTEFFYELAGVLAWPRLQHLD